MKWSAGWRPGGRYTMVETVFIVEDLDCFCVSGPRSTKDGSIVEDALRIWKLGTGSKEETLDSAKLRFFTEDPARF